MCVYAIHGFDLNNHRFQHPNVTPRGNKLQFLDGKQPKSAEVAVSNVWPRIKNGMVFWVLPACNSLGTHQMRAVFRIFGVSPISVIAIPHIKGMCLATLTVNCKLYMFDPNIQWFIIW